MNELVDYANREILAAHTMLQGGVLVLAALTLPLARHHPEHDDDENEEEEEV